VLAIGLLSVSCRPDRKPIKIQGPNSGGIETDLGLEDLRKSLESTVLENYVQLTYGNIEAYLDRVATEGEVQFIGVTPGDVLVGVNPPGLREDRRLYRRRRLRILSKNLDVHLSQDGSVGWVYDEVSYRVEYMGREASIPIRSTSLYLRDVERWVLAAGHLSYSVPIGELIAVVARGKFRKGASMKTEPGPSKELSASLVGIVGRFINGSADKALVHSDESSLLLLPGPEQEYHGEECLDAPPLAQTIGEGATVAVKNYRVQLSSSKRVAWLVANLSARGDFNGDLLEIPLRGSFVLEKRGEGDWLIAQAHISAPFSENELSALVFGPSEDE
jgi:ketosteroid isomerase-like protein